MLYCVSSWHWLAFPYSFGAIASSVLHPAPMAVVGTVVSCSFLSNGSESSPKKDNSWLDVPGVILDVERGRRFGSYSRGATMEVKRVLLMSSGNDIRTTKGTRTRPHLPQDTSNNIRTDIEEWRACGASVDFVFCGSWAMDGAGFSDSADLEAPDRYEHCRQEILVAAAQAGAQVLKTPDYRAFQGIPRADAWHFSSDAKVSLQKWLLNFLIAEAAWPLLGSATPTPSEFGDTEEQREPEEQQEPKVESSGDEGGAKKCKEEDFLQRVKDFMLAAGADRDALLPRRNKHSECICGYSCGQDWPHCCDSCWSFSGVYFKTLVDLEHETHDPRLKKVPASLLRRIVCERNPRIWLYINKLS